MNPDNGEYERKMAALEKSAGLLADLLKDESVGDLHARLSSLAWIIPEWNPDRKLIADLVAELDEMLCKAAYQLAKYEPTDEYF